MHGLYRIQILADHRFQAPCSLHNITLDPADDPQIAVRVHKNPYIHQFTEFPVFKNQNSFYDHNLPRHNGNGVFAPVVDLIIINRTFHRPSGFQFTKVLDHQFRIMSFVVIIMLQNCHMIPKLACDLIGQCGLSAS